MLTDFRDESFNMVFMKTIATMNEIVDDVMYMNVSEETSFTAYLFEVIEIFVKDGRSLYTGIMFALVSIVIMILDYFE